MNEIWINNLRKKLSDFLNIDYDESLYTAKIEESKTIKFKHKKSFYKNLVFNEIHDKVIENFEVDIEICETKDQHDIWEYFRVNTSSIRSKKNVGRLIRILVKHRATQKYIGILSLASDIYACAARDNYIGLNSSNRGEKLVYVMNITTCVGLQPLAFNFNIGKLLVALCFSKELHDYIHTKYGHNIACITTFSINGKSVQYDRLNYLKFVGETKGYALTNIPDTLYNSCIRYLKSINDHKALSYKNRMYKLNKVFSHLDICCDESHKRGVYVGFTSPDSKDFFNNKLDTFDVSHLQSINEICEWWKTRWAAQRYNHLKCEERLRYKIEFHNAWNQLNNERVQRSCTKKKELVGEELYNAEKNEYMKTYRYKQIAVIYKKQIDVNNKWLAGFYDGDGCTEYVNGIVRLSIGQCNPYPLMAIYSNYGGTMRVSKNTGDNSRMIYKWCLCGSYTQQFIDDVLPHCILERKKLGSAITNGEEVTSHVKLWNEQYEHLLNDEYIAGFFDAEGEIGLCLHSDGRNASYSVKITQKSQPDMLFAFLRYFGYGSVDKIRFSIYKGENIKNFLSRMIPYFVVKKKQAQILMDYLNKTSELQDAIQNIRGDKHKVYDINKFLKTKDITTTKVSKKPKFEEVNNDDPNYNHRLNLKYGCAKSKHNARTVSDEQIEQIRLLGLSGKTKTEIAEEFNLSRQYISDIISKKVLTLEELEQGDTVKTNLDKKINDREELKKTNMSLKEWGIMKSALAKRKVQPITILQVMELKINNNDMLLTHILETIKKNDVNLTMDMVKNYTKGKINMFSPEFPIQNYSWDDFISMKTKLTI